MAVLNNQDFLSSIRPDMRLTKGFFKSTYCREMDCPGFAEQVITALETAGCSHARQYYEDWVNEYETERDAQLKRVSEWYWKECEKEWEKKRKEKEGGVRRKRREGRQNSRKWMDGLY